MFELGSCYNSSKFMLDLSIITKNKPQLQPSWDLPSQTTGTLEQSVKYVQVNNKDTRRTPSKLTIKTPKLLHNCRLRCNWKRFSSFLSRIN